MTKRSYLIDEYPLLVLPSLARMIGLNEAIVLQQLHYWLENPKGGVELDGYRWVYNTYEQWQADNFPFWSVRTVVRVFTRLETIGVVISKQQASYDRKKYYRVHYDKLASWNEPDCHNADLQNGTMDHDKMASSLTDTTPDTTNKELINIPGQKEWEQALTQFKGEMNKGTFDAYLKNTLVARYDGNAMEIGVPTAQVCEWLDSRMKRSAERLLVGILAREITVQFVVLDGVAA